MAEVFTKGVDGAIYLAGKIQARITNFTMTMDAPTEDVTDFGSDGQENEYTGLANFAGTLNGQTLRTDSNTTQQTQTLMEMFASTGTLAAVQAKFIESTRAMWWGNVKFTNFSKDAPSQGIQTFSGNWVQSTGRLKFDTSTST